MPALRDLAVCDHLPRVADHILAVGWLGQGLPYSRGPTARDVFDRLLLFAAQPWQPCVSMGVHECELCQFAGERVGSSNLYIPFDGKIYVAPELITHYINAHYYQPPRVFCEAVLACPAMDSMEYKQLLVKCRGQVLWQMP